MTAMLKKHWKVLVVFAAAIFLRIIFFHGFFPSDQYSYSLDAVKFVDGSRWESNYTGSTRWGIILPTAFFYRLFGITDFTSALWAMLCSLAAVFLAYQFGKNLRNEQTGLFAGLLLAAFPLDVIYSGQFMGDTPMGFWLLLTLYSLWSSAQIEAQKSRRAYLLLGGFAFGMAYATKDVAIALLPLCLIFPSLLRRQFDRQWFWVFLGFGPVLCFEYLFFFLMTGNAFHRHLIFLGTRATRAQEILHDASYLDHSLGKYFYWLFVDVHYTGVAFIVLAIVLAIYAVKYRRTPGGDFSFGPLLLWSGAILALLTFFPLSIKPYYPIFKLPNYMLMFAAPLLVALAAALQSLTRRVRYASLALIVLGCFPAAYISQESNRAHVDNSRQIHEFYRAHRDRPLYASDYNIAFLEYAEDFKTGAQLKSFTLNTSWRSSSTAVDFAAFDSAYVAIDQYFIEFYSQWGHTFPSEILNPPSHWQPVFRYQRQPSFLQRVFLPPLESLQQKNLISADFYLRLSRKMKNWSHSKPVIIYDTSRSPTSAFTNAASTMPKP